MPPASDSNKTYTGITGKSSENKLHNSTHCMIQIAQACEYDMQKLSMHNLSDNCSLLKKASSRKSSDELRLWLCHRRKNTAIEDMATHK